LRDREPDPRAAGNALEFDLIAEEVFEGVAAADEVGEPSLTRTSAGL